MVKIGKFLILAFCFFLIPIQAQDKIELFLTDANGRQTRTIALGQTLHFKIKCTNASIDIATLMVPGMEYFASEPRGAYKTVYSVNGTTSYSIEQMYALHAKKLGSFTLGPVQYTDSNGVTLTSNKIDVVCKKGIKATNNKDDIFVECIFEKTIAYPGEPLQVTIRVNTCKDMQILELALPELDKDIFSLSALAKGDDGKKVINGKEYMYYEWQTTLIAKKAGEYIIPPVTMLCQTNRQIGNLIGAAALLHFGFGLEQKKIYGHGTIVEILPLPDYHKPVDAVGIFDELSMQVHQEQIPCGQGTVLTIKISGEGDLEAVKVPKVSVEQGLCCYESAATINNKSKIFEYVLQAVQPGTWTINCAEFVYFNPATKTFNILQAEPLQVNVQANNSLPAVVDKQTDQHNSNQDINEDQLFPINESGPWHADYKPRTWRWFLFISIIGIFYLLYTVARALYGIYSNNRQDITRHKLAFKIAKQRLQQAEKENNTAFIYDIFITLFADYCLLPKANVTQEKIETLLQESAYTKDEIEQWQRFYYEISSGSFAGHSSAHSTALFKRAFILLDQLRARL